MAMHPKANITFGKLTDATTEKPSRYQRYNYNEVPKWEINTNDIETRIAKGEVTLASKDIAGSAQKTVLLQPVRMSTNMSKVNGPA